MPAKMTFFSKNTKLNTHKMTKSTVLLEMFPVQL